MRMSIILLCLVPWVMQAQNSLTIEKCYELARANYPLIKQKQLIEQSTSFSVSNVQSGLLPQFSINGQATYQSDVTQVPSRIPGLEIEPLSKDQYRIYGELNQTIYDGGSNFDHTQIIETNAKADDQKIEVELYKIRERTNQIYFGILLVDDQLAQLEILKKDLENNIARTEAAVRNGTAFQMNVNQFKAEYLKAEQHKIELSAMRQSYATMLGYFVNQPLGQNVQLEKPVAIMYDEAPTLSRPELTLYNYQADLLAAQYNLGKNKTTPRVGFFVQGGYGRPGLNMLKNEFVGYYQGGIRFNWSLSGLYNDKRDRQILDLNLQQIETQRETFVFNNNLVSSQQLQELDKLKKLIEVDKEIIELRTEIKNTSQVQQENGVITTNDYLRELNAEDQAKQNLLLHQTQLLMTLYSYKFTLGN